MEKQRSLDKSQELIEEIKSLIQKAVELEIIKPIDNSKITEVTKKIFIEIYKLAP
jgi:hypothetical protein